MSKPAGAGAPSEANFHKYNLAEVSVDLAHRSNKHCISEPPTRPADGAASSRATGPSQGPSRTRRQATPETHCSISQNKKKTKILRAAKTGKSVASATSLFCEWRPHKKILRMASATSIPGFLHTSFLLCAAWPVESASLTARWCRVFFTLCVHYPAVYELLLANTPSP